MLKVIPTQHRWPILAALVVVALMIVAYSTTAAFAQPGGEEGGPSAAPTPQNAGDVNDSTGDETGDETGDTTSDAGDQTPAADQGGINWLQLARRGGFWMIPILAMSLLTATFVVERSIGLRRGRVLPEPLVRSLGQLGGDRGAFDPRQAYRLCQQHPSAAANVIRAMLLKVGRPHSEVEHAVNQASEREADRLYANVRWLNLAAAVAPLLGLLGTVSGMIRAFYETTLLAPGQNKADKLAEGIYEALVTTLSGLTVAIIAAFFAHLFEGRIQSLFRQIDELLFNLLPQIERFEGRVRFGRTSNDQEALVSPAASGENSQPPSRAARPAQRT